ncbi:MAG: PSD1 domain-containing protein [Planctomycetia bacterium]|nr:PSD1 domain-containing protein [Planctomycetia bacterium]
MTLNRSRRASERSIVAAPARRAVFIVGHVLFTLAGTSWAADLPVDHTAQMAQSMELFKSQVRGLLTQNCLKCHGGEKTKGEFDLTTRDGLLKGGELGPAIVVGKPGESLLVRLVRHEDEPNMPEDAPKLPDAVIDQITAWIASGAAYDKPLVDTAATITSKTVSESDRQFWSFQPLKKPAMPSVANKAWCRTPLDKFILARLEAKNLSPNNAADRRKLIRRAYFDLIGLPPSPEQVEAFVADQASDAYDRLVDRLLNSPHYGERWARHWLDLARFAESHGYEQDYDRPSAYHYRDFVIQALNEDTPYDRFVRLQIAGDEFEPDNNLALMATGFLGAGTHATQITANQVEKERYDELDDMAATVGTAMLGLTIGCARCHDHKFDPIPQADYYRLVSTFTTTVRSEIDLDFHPERYREAKAAFDRAHAPLAEALAKFEKEQLPGRYDMWLASDAKPVAPKWLVPDVQSAKSDGGATFTRQQDGSYLASGKNASSDVYTFVVQTSLKGVTAVRLDALVDSSLPKNGPGRAANGNFALSDFQLWAAPTGSQAPGAPVKLVNPKATFEQAGLPIGSAIDDNKMSAWAVDPKTGQDHAASFELETPIAGEQGTALTFILKFENNTGHNLGRVRLSLSNAAKPVGLDGEQVASTLVDEINQALATAAELRNDSQRAALLAWYRERDADWKKLSDAVQEHLKQTPKPELTKVMVATEGLPAIRLHTQGADFFEHTYYLKRGDLNQKIGAAEQSFLQVLMSVPELEKHWQVAPPSGWRTSYRRRALANWITDPNGGAGHLLARVIVNRLWQHHLGRGIVATPSDFGAQGERPTHPELLDYLADQLIQNGWRLKEIHKLIMTSAVYMQGTDADPKRASVDPDNLLLWHRSRQRLEAEVVRDAMLAASGQLDERMFGPGSLDESHRRRSIYFTIKRSQLVPSMILFDAPDSLQGLGQRSSTTVAPQALAMLNSAQIQGYARAFAKGLLSKEGTVTEGAIRRGYLTTLGRPPDSEELTESTAFVKRATESYQAAGKSDAGELALADFCQILLSLNEFIYVE